MIIIMITGYAYIVFCTQLVILSLGIRSGLVISGRKSTPSCILCLVPANLSENSKLITFLLKVCEFTTFI